MATESTGIEKGVIPGSTTYDLIVAPRKGEGAIPQSARKIGFVILGICVFLGLFHLFISRVISIDIYAQRFSVLSLFIVLCLLTHPLGRRSWKDKISLPFILDAAMCLFLLCVTCYVLRDPLHFEEGFYDITMTEVVLGTVYIAILVESIRRIFGWVLVVIVAFFLVQNVTSQWLPGILGGPAVSWTRVIQSIWFGGAGLGIFGSLIGLLTNYLVMFMLFIAMLLSTGATDWLIKLSLAVTGKFTGGPAKVAVVASALLGTLTGSPAADVAGTGSVTIPMMKRYGYSPEFAGAVAAIAGTGSQLMPPIMGLAAFMMATLIGIDYWHIALAAVPVAVLFYFGVFMQIHFRSQSMNMKGLRKEEIPPLVPTLIEGWAYVIPLVVLVYMMARGLSLQYAAFMALVAVFIVSFFKKSTRISPVGFLSAIDRGAAMSTEIAIALAMASIITATFYISGLTVQITPFVMSVGGGQLLPIALMTAVACLILGLGLPTSAIYILLFVTVIPILTELKVTPLAANMFPFYYGSLATVTPPVALAAYVAAGIAGGSFVKTGFESFRLGASAYFIPFTFLLAPALLLEGPLIETFYLFFMAAIGILGLAGGLQGYFFTGRLNMLQRVIMIVGGLVLMLPFGWLWNIVGIALLLAAIFPHVLPRLVRRLR